MRNLCLHTHRILSRFTSKCRWPIFQDLKPTYIYNYTYACHCMLLIHVYGHLFSNAGYDAKITFTETTITCLRRCQLIQQLCYSGRLGLRAVYWIKPGSDYKGRSKTWNGCQHVASIIALFAFNLELGLRPHFYLVETLYTNCLLLV